MIDLSLAGHAALVTGAGRGLGQAIADGLAELGATVHASSRDDATARELAARYGTSPVVLDVRDVAGTRAVADRLASDGVDLLVNNGGVNVPQRVLDVDEASWDVVHDTNVRGAFFTTQSFARAWRARGVRGSVVGVGSQAGIVAIEERVSYGSSKAALHHVTKVLALELAEYGIRVNAIAPTFIRTQLTASTLEDAEFAGELLGRIPLGRFGDAQDVVGAVAYLLSPIASLVTGHTLVVDGGYTIH